MRRLVHWAVLRARRKGTAVAFFSAMKRRRVVTSASLSLLLLSIAEGCSLLYDERTCPPGETSQTTAQDLCAKISNGTYKTSTSRGSLERSDWKTCSVEGEFLNQLYTLNPHLYGGAPVPIAPDASDANLGDATLDASPDAEGWDARFDASFDASADGGPDGSADAGTKPPLVITCPKIEGAISMTCANLCQFGRPFEGFEVDSELSDGPKAFFAACARTEAASVDAFLILAEELRALSAPAELVQDCLNAADDERAHAKTMSQLADIDCVTIAAPPRARRNAFAMALENARAGLVVETFAALLNHYQALHAPSAGLRGKLAVVAADESRHAAISRKIHAFAVSQLSDEQRRAVEEARTEAVAGLKAQICQAPLTSFHAAVGFPSRSQQLAMFARMEQEVWAHDQLAA